MRTEVTLEQAIGKTLMGSEASYTTGQMVLAFTDGTFTTLGVSRGYEAGDEAVRRVDLELLDFGDEKLIRLGVATYPELSAIRTERNAKLNSHRDAYERQEFLRLQRKFGSSPQ